MPTHRRNQSSGRAATAALTLLATVALAQSNTSPKVSKHDAASSKKLASELLAQVQKTVQSETEVDECFSMFALKRTDPLYKLLVEMTDQNIKDVELFDDGAYLEMQLVGADRSAKVTVIVRLAEDKCVSFEAEKGK